MKKKFVVIIVILVAFIFGISGYLIGKQYSVEEVETYEEKVSTFLKDITSPEIIAIYLNNDGVWEYLMTDQNTIEKLLVNIQSYDVEKLENESGELEMVDGGSSLIVVTREDSYSISFSPLEYKVYCGEFYTTDNNKEFADSIMKIFLDDIKINNAELYQRLFEGGVYDYYFK